MVISVLEVISIVQLHILVCLPNIDDRHFDKMATILEQFEQLVSYFLLCRWTIPFYKKNEFYFAAAAVVAVTAAAVIV